MTMLTAVPTRMAPAATVPVTALTRASMTTVSGEHECQEEKQLGGISGDRPSVQIIEPMLCTLSQYIYDAMATNAVMGVAMRWAVAPPHHQECLRGVIMACTMQTCWTTCTVGNDDDVDPGPRSSTVQMCWTACAVGNEDDSSSDSWRRQWRHGWRD